MPSLAFYIASRRSCLYTRTALGDYRKAIDMCKALLSDLARVLGPDHLHTLAISQFLSVLRDQGGGAEKNQQ